MPVQTNNTRQSVHKYAAISLAGLIFGAVAMLVSLGLCAGARAQDGSRDWSHYVILMPTVGLIYSVLIGLWAAWVRRSALWVVVALAAGCFFGVAWYFWFRSFLRNELLVFVLGPCLLGACASAIHGWSIQPTWSASLVRLKARFLKGLVAGLALGVTASVTFEAFDSVSIPGMKINKNIAYLAAMTFSSCLFLILLYWACEFNKMPLRATGAREA